MCLMKHGEWGWRKYRRAIKTQKGSKQLPYRGDTEKVHTFQSVNEKAEGRWRLMKS